MSEITLDGVCLSVKRLYLPVILKSTCPNCKEKVECDLDRQPLSYPIVGKEEVIDFYCFECGHEYTRDLILKMTLEYEEGVE